MLKKIRATTTVAIAATAALTLTLLVEGANANISARTGNDDVSNFDAGLTRNNLRTPKNALNPTGSIGFPDSLDEQLIRSEVLGRLETPVSNLPDGEDLRHWSDEQILQFHDQEIDLITYWLNQVRHNPSLIADIGQSLEANLGGAKGTSMSGLSCLAIAIQGEAGGEPYAGKLAVAETILTRAKGNPARICSVIFAHAQFEAMTKRAQRPSAETMRAANEALKSPKKCGFDHFINKRLQMQLGRSIPTWVTNFERRGCYSRTIGQQVYYASCKCNSGNRVASTESSSHVLQGIFSSDW